jgi:glycyl-tRNA synthetase
MSDLVELAKRRGFFFQSSEAYGGVGGFYTYGPAGAALKRNVESAWRDRFAVREGHTEIDAPTVMPEAVFEASGHLDGFDDMLVECPACGESHRADHLVEDHTPIEEAEGYDPEEIADLLAEYELACPSCGEPLAGEPVEEFNLMFGTNIGPGSSQPGYLRPETAQGIFVEFPRLKEYARGQLPFGVTQIGTAYRNEISPRKSLVRVREFTQAELELFVAPDDDGPDLDAVADVELPLYPAADEVTVAGQTLRGQHAEDGEAESLTVAEAVESGVVADAWIAHFLGVARRWYERVGIDMDRFRFRQHQAGERAHYAADCWDAEADVSAPGDDPDWIELAGFADRGAYDLSKHADHGDDDFTVFVEYDEPRTVERAVVDPDMSVLGPEYGERAGAVAAELAALAERDPDAFAGETVTVEVDGETVTVEADVANFRIEEVTEAGEHIRPHVIEPSFGVDRTVYTLLVHGYGEDVVDGEERTSLSLSPEVAPTDVAVFPLVSDPDIESVTGDVLAALRAAGLSAVRDDSGNIGRRYRRQDEVGTPLCVTVDHESVEDDPTTVTVRDRDTTAQARVPVDDLADELGAILDGEAGFDDLLAAHERVETDVSRS